MADQSGSILFGWTLGTISGIASGICVPIILDWYRKIGRLRFDVDSGWLHFSPGAGQMSFQLGLHLHVFNSYSKATTIVLESATFYDCARTPLWVDRSPSVKLGTTAIREVDLADGMSTAIDVEAQIAEWGRVELVAQSDRVEFAKRVEFVTLIFRQLPNKRRAFSYELGPMPENYRVAAESSGEGTRLNFKR